MSNLVHGKIFTTKVFVFLDETSYFLDITFLVIDIVVLVREIKKYFTCYILLRQQIILTAKITAINEATTDLKKLQIYRLKNKLANFYRRLGRRTFYVCQANLSGPTFYFRKTICMRTCGNEQKFIKQNFETMRQHTLNS